MKRFLYFCTLLLLLDGCNDDQPNPALESALAGRWLLRSFTSYSYDSTGAQKTGQWSVIDASQTGRYLIVTDTTLQRFQPDGTATSPAQRYLRTDSVLTFVPQTPFFTTLTKLTATELAIREKVRARQGSRTVYMADEWRYVRQ